MADLTLKLDADAAAAQQQIAALANSIVQFGKDAVNAFIDQEKADAKLEGTIRRMGLSVAALAPKFKAQASAMQESVGIGDDVVQSMQSILLAHNVASDEIERTVRALVDYAEFSGTDAVSATETLVKAVEKGSDGIKGLGVNYKSTGSQAEDLNRAVDALTKKYEGEALIQARTFGGQLRILKGQYGELLEQVGKFLVGIATQTGIVEHASFAMKEYNFLISEETKEERERLKQLDGTNRLRDERNRLYKEGLVLEKASTETAQKELAQIATRIVKLDAEIQKREEAGRKRQAEITARLKAEAAAAAEAERLRLEQESKRDAEADKTARKRAEEEAAEAKTLEERRKNNEAFTKFIEGFAARQVATNVMVATAVADAAKKEEEALSKQAQAREDWANKVTDLRRKVAIADKQLAEEAVKKSDEMGAAVAGAFISAFESEMSNVKSGEEFDIGNVLKSLIPALITIAMLSNPATQAFAPVVGGAVSLLLKSFHRGGMVDRYHDGGTVEVPAILEAGEYVVPRKQVQALGGGAGVQRALGGGGGGVTVITALDARSFQERIGTDLGSAQARALRQQRGDLAQILRRSGINFYY